MSISRRKILALVVCGVIVTIAGAGEAEVFTQTSAQPAEVKIGKLIPRGFFP